MTDMQKRYFHPPTLTPCTGYEIEELASVGWITITSLGEENVYFTRSDGTLGYVKLG